MAGSGNVVKTIRCGEGRERVMKVLLLRFGGFSGINRSIAEEFERRNFDLLEIDGFDAINPRKRPTAAFINLVFARRLYGRKWRLGLEYTPFGFREMSMYCEKKRRRSMQRS